MPRQEGWGFFQMQNYNLVHTVKDISNESGAITEPVSVSEVKSYMRLEGFQDIDQSDSTPFTDDDALIEKLIVSARKKIEKLYSISLVPKTLKATITNLAGDIEIPYGPVLRVSSLTDRYNSVISSASYKLIGDDFQTLECPKYEKMTITYTAGYSEVPEALQVEIMRIVSYWYENRDNADMGLKEFSFQTQEYNRTPWLM